MIPKLAIERAVAGGWDGDWDNVLGPIEHRGTENACGWEPVCLSRSFWQALGKALGWQYFEEIEGWRYLAHRFYDLILIGGDTDKFWADLLK